MNIKNLFVWQWKLERFMRPKLVIGFVSAALLLGMSLLADGTAYSDTKCPKPILANDPFSEFDVMTEEEKRQALHLELKKKLASDKVSCPPPLEKKSGSFTQPSQSASSNDATGGEQGEQLSEQNSPQPDLSQQSAAENDVSGQPTANNEDQYTSPWSYPQKPVSEDGVVALEIRDPKKKPMETTAASGSTVASQASTQLSGDTQTPQQSSATGADQQTRESIEDIANRYKNSGNGSPGKSLPNQQSRDYIPGQTAGQTETISANDAAIKKLEERLATETDPAKKKEIQAELNRIKKNK